MILEETLNKRLYVYRRSYKDFSHLSTGLSVGKAVFGASGLSGLVIAPLAALSLGAVVIETIDKSLSISERKQEYKIAYKFYKEILNLYKAGELSESEVYLRENAFISNLQYFPREKYMKEMKLNGYS